MLKYSISIALLLVMNIGLSQQPLLQWAKAFTATSYISRDLSNGRSIAVDAQGNVYSAGLFMHTVDFDPGPNVYSLTAADLGFGIYISKLSSTGEFIWAKQIPVLVEGNPIEIRLDKNGNVYLTAGLKRPSDMDPGPGVHIVTPIGAKDAFVLKLDTDGNFVWVKQFGGIGDTVPYGSSLDIDNNGNVIICGIFNNTVDFDPGPNTFNLTTFGGFESFITKLTSDGDFVWAKKMGDYKNNYSANYAIDIKCDAAGNIYSTGFFSGDCDFDPGIANYNIIATGINDGFVTKLDVDGNFVWAKKIGVAADNILHPISIKIDSDNNIYTTGSFLGTQDFDPGPNTYNLTSNGSTDAYILKLSQQGNFIWAKNFGAIDGDDGADIAIDNQNNVYLLGLYSGTVDFDPGPGVFSFDKLNGAVISKYKPDGTFVYASAFKGIGYGYNLGRRLVVDPAQSIYFTGFIAGETDFDPGPNIFSLIGSADESPFVTKLSMCTNITRSTVYINTCSSYMLNNISYDSTGVYTQVIPNYSGCDSIITLQLTINKKFTEQTKTICEGESFFAGGAKQQVAGVYKDTLFSYLNCDSIVTTHLIVNPKPLPNLGTDKNICSNEVLTVSPGIFSSYLWQDLSTQSAFNIQGKGKYWVKVMDNNNCTAIDSIVINSVNPIPQNFLKNSDSICSYSKILVTPIYTYSKYLWSTGSTDKTIEVQTPGDYLLTVTDAQGCIGIDTISVYVKDCMLGVYVPTAFSPNGDGKNDFFHALVFGKIISFKIQVFDKYGQIVFQSTDPNQKWNGSTKGIPYSATTFVWQCSYQFENKPPEYQKGTILLLQ